MVVTRRQFLKSVAAAVFTDKSLLFSGQNPMPTQKTRTERLYTAASKCGRRPVWENPKALLPTLDILDSLFQQPRPVESHLCVHDCDSFARDATVVVDELFDRLGYRDHKADEIQKLLWTSLMKQFYGPGELTSQPGFIYANPACVSAAYVEKSVNRVRPHAFTDIRRIPVEDRRTRLRFSRVEGDPGITIPVKGRVVKPRFSFPDPQSTSKYVEIVQAGRDGKRIDGYPYTCLDNCIGQMSDDYRFQMPASQFPANMPTLRSEDGRDICQDARHLKFYDLLHVILCRVSARHGHLSSWSDRLVVSLNPSDLGIVTITTQFLDFDQSVDMTYGLSNILDKALPN